MNLVNIQYDFKFEYQGRIQTLKLEGARVVGRGLQAALRPLCNTNEPMGFRHTIPLKSSVEKSHEFP